MKISLWKIRCERSHLRLVHKVRQLTLLIFCLIPSKCPLTVDPLFFRHPFIHNERFASFHRLYLCNIPVCRICWVFLYSVYALFHNFSDTFSYFVNITYLRRFSRIFDGCLLRCFPDYCLYLPFLPIFSGFIYGVCASSPIFGYLSFLNIVCFDNFQFIPVLISNITATAAMRNSWWKKTDNNFINHREYYEGSVNTSIHMNLPS